MKNYDQLVEINKNSDWSYISSEQDYALRNLRKHQWPDIDNIYLFVKNPPESKYQLLINGREKFGRQKLKNHLEIKVFIDSLQTIDDVYENLESYNPTKKRKVLRLFEDMIPVIKANKKFLHCS